MNSWKPFQALVSNILSTGSNLILLLTVFMALRELWQQHQSGFQFLEYFLTTKSDEDQIHEDAGLGGKEGKYY